MSKKFSLVKPLLVSAMSSALLLPSVMSLLKSSTAFPIHIRRTRKAVSPKSSQSENITVHVNASSRTNHEPKQANPSRRALNHWLVESGGHFCSKRSPKRSHSKENEENYGEADGNCDEGWSCGRRGSQHVGSSAW